MLLSNAPNSSDSALAAATPGTPKRTQAFKNGEVHDWYKIVLGYPDHFVADIISELGLKSGDDVLDPFSGSGTTAVECKKRGINCWAVDANPVAYFASRVKTHWKLDLKVLRKIADVVSLQFPRIRKNEKSLQDDPTFIYMQASGMIDRGWISEARLLDVLAIKAAIFALREWRPYKNVLNLAAMNVLVYHASNVRFGPELYCGGAQERDPTIDLFEKQMQDILCDLKVARAVLNPGHTTVRLSDSRDLNKEALNSPEGGFHAIICSPPYPTEHDYTRNARLELAFLESIKDRESLRKIKRMMIRSHTKGVYITDDDCKLISGNLKVSEIVTEIEARAEKKTHGFARLYGKVTKTYFGGMKRHLQSALPLLKDGSYCAYVVGDQASYLQVKIPTAEILGEIALEIGFRQAELRVFRTKWSTKTKSSQNENVLLLKK